MFALHRLTDRVFGTAIRLIGPTVALSTLTSPVMAESLVNMPTAHLSPTDRRAVEQLILSRIFDDDAPELRVTASSTVIDIDTPTRDDLKTYLLGSSGDRINRAQIPSPWEATDEHGLQPELVVVYDEADDHVYRDTLEQAKARVQKLSGEFRLIWWPGFQTLVITDVPDHSVPDEVTE